MTGDVTPAPAVPEQLNLAAHVLSAGAQTPDKTAFEMLGPAGSESWSYARLRAAVATAAEWVRRSSVPMGGRILIRIGNSIEFPVVFLGAIAAGRVPVPTSAALTEAEITKIAEKLALDLIITDGSSALPRFNAPVVKTGDVLATQRDAEFRCADTQANDPAYIVFTSGSSGTPRGVIHAHRAIIARKMMIDGWYGLTPDDRLMHSGAFNWTYTLGTGLLDPWSIGATALIPAPETSPARFPFLIKRHDATIFASVPGIYRKLLRSALPAMPELRHCLSAGEKLPDPIRTAWRDATQTDIHEAFGMSECSTFVSGSPAYPAPEGTLGFAQPGRRIAIRENGAEVPSGETGTLAIHKTDPGLMLGYLDDPQAQARHQCGDWFLSGDYASADATGAIRYHGRVDDLMVAGGFRVSPIEVEQAMTTLPQIHDAAAVDLALDSTTQVIALFYVADHPVDEALLDNHAATVLAPYKCPRKFVHVVTLPRGANGKLLRRMLRNPDRGA
jgi:acyl-coenzyme A synthetase/AMP-(fatty) acid ligase